MALSTGQPPIFSRSTHLVELIAEVERLAAQLAAADPAARRQVAEARADAVIRATLTLDGARSEQLPGPDEATAALEAAAPIAADPADRRGTWLDVFRVLEDPSDRQVRALEVLGARAADAADDLVEPLLSDPQTTLAELHRRLTRGLVADERVGAPRAIEQAVHDGATGRILYLTPEPDRVASELALVCAWLDSAASREHGLIVAGVLHHELLRIHPYDAANGRLARAAARLVLRARGLDPDHLAAPEPVLAEDPLGYHEELARSLRRRDLTIWLERWGEAVSEGLRRSARAVGALDVEVVARARRFVADRAAFTVADYRADAAASPTQAREELAALLDAGLIARVPGSRGLRFTVSG